MLHHFRDNGMFRRERGECRLVGGELAGLGFLRLGIEREFAEKNFAELLRRADVEIGAGVVVDGLLKPRDVGAQFFADFFQRDGVEADAFVFHRGEHGQQRRLDFGEDFFLARFLEQRGEFGVELQGEIGAFHRAARAELGRIRRFHRGEEILLAGRFLRGNRRVVEERFGDEFEGVAQVGEDDAVREGSVEKGRGIFDGINGMDGITEFLQEGSPCTFDVVADKGHLDQIVCSRFKSEV